MFQESNLCRPFNNLFRTIASANNAGYFSRSHWRKLDRKLKEDAIPSLLCLKTVVNGGKPSWFNYVIEIISEDRWIGCSPNRQETWLVFSIDQTTKVRKRIPKKKKSKKELCRLYCPEKLSLEEIPTEITDGVLWTANHIHRSSIQWQQDDNGYVHIHSRIANSVTGKDWTKIKAWLLDNGIIETDGFYIKGEKATGYRFAEGYHKVRLLKYDSPQLHGKMKSEKRKLQPVHLALQKKFKLLKINLDHAVELIPQIYQDYLKNTEEQNRWKRQFNKRQKPIESEKVYRERVHGLIDLINHHDAEIGICDFGRLHSPVTRLPTDLRKALTVNGEPLINMDLANSQPLIAGLLARKYVSNRKTKYRLMAKTFRSENPYTQSRRELANLEKQLHEIIGGCSRNCGNSRPPDLDHYLSVCEQGLFYETIKSILGNDVPRKRIKKEVLTYFYADPCKVDLYTNVGPAMKELFPTVDEMLNDLKSKDVSQAAKIMQNWESTIFIDSICSQLLKELPADSPLFTLHDGLLLTAEHELIARKVITNVFAKYDCKPTIKTG